MVELNTQTQYISESDLPSEALSDPGLSQLREQIKQVMIPLLIKTFQLRLEVQQVNSPPSRLYNVKPRASLTDLIDQLKQLDQDLALLQVWNQSCRSQIEKVLLEAQERPSSLSNSFQTKHQASPSVQKSFQEALLSGKNHIMPAPLTQKKDSWWKKLFKKGI